VYRPTPVVCSLAVFSFLIRFTFQYCSSSSSSNNNNNNNNNTNTNMYVCTRLFITVNIAVTLQITNNKEMKNTH